MAGPPSLAHLGRSPLRKNQRAELVHRRLHRHRRPRIPRGSPLRRRRPPHRAGENLEMVLLLPLLHPEQAAGHGGGGGEGGGGRGPHLYAAAAALRGGRQYVDGANRGSFHVI